MGTQRDPGSRGQNSTLTRLSGQFEDFKLVGAVGPLDPKIPNGYHDFDWSGLIVGTIAPVGQFLLPQGKKWVYSNTSYPVFSL